MGEARVVNFQGFFQFGVELEVWRHFAHCRRPLIERWLVGFRDDLPGVALFIERSEEALSPFFWRLREPRSSRETREAPPLESDEEPRKMDIRVLRRELPARLPRSV